jgi:hypothetical protein
MTKLLANLIIRLVPANWYTAKKTCDAITKICDTILELKWYAWLSVACVVVALCVTIVFYLRYKIIKLRRL